MLSTEQWDYKLKYGVLVPVFYHKINSGDGSVDGRAPKRLDIICGDIT